MKKNQITIKDMSQLLNLVGANRPVEATLWNGMKIKGDYHKGSKKPDAITPGNVFWDFSSLRPLVNKLVSDGKSLITQTEENDMVCRLEWSIA